MTYLNLILFAYVVSVMCSYLLLRHTVRDLVKIRWTCGDRVLAIFFSLIPVVGLVTTIGVFFFEISRVYWTKECKW